MRGNIGWLTGSKRGGMVSFVREDGKPFWGVAKWVVKI